MSTEQETKADENSNETPDDDAKRALNSFGKFILNNVLAGCIVGVFLWWWTSASPYLYYSTSQSVVFEGETNRFGILSVQVNNEGSKAAENVSCYLELKNATIKEVRATPINLNPAVELRDGHLTVSIATLNAGEKFQVSIMATDFTELPDWPDFKIRGKDVIGHTFGEFKWWYGILIVFILLLFAAIAIQEKEKEAEAKADKEKVKELTERLRLRQELNRQPVHETSEPPPQNRKRPKS